MWSFVKILMVLMLAFTMSACVYRTAEPSKPNPEALKQKQVEMLQKYGFVLTKDGWSLAMTERLLFDTNSSVVQIQRQVMLRDLAKMLQQYRLYGMKVVGHTDNVGTVEYNQELSLRRANAVADILVSAGYPDVYIQRIGRGMSQPVVPNDSEENRAENRRVTLVIGWNVNP